jgi:hypothetical protein
LIGVLRIDTEAHVHLQSLVEFGEFDLLGELNGFVERVATLLDLRSRSRVLLACFLTHLRTSTGTSGLGYLRGGNPLPPKLTVAGVHKEAPAT